LRKNNHSKEDPSALPVRAGKSITGEPMEPLRVADVGIHGLKSSAVSFGTVGFG